MINLGDLDEYRAYFEAVATNYVDIAHNANDERDHHFAMADEELELALSGSMTNIVLALDWPMESVTDGGGDNPIDDIVATVSILIYPESERLPHKYAALNKCLAICKQIVSRLKDDFENSVITYFDIGTVELFPIKAKGLSGWVGWSFSFSVLDSGNYNLDVAKWNDLS